MDYEKEYEKFAFGVGMEKTAGKGRVVDVVSPDDKKSAPKDDKQVLAELLLTVGVSAAGYIYNVKKKKKAEQKKQQKKAKKKKN